MLELWFVLEDHLMDLHWCLLFVVDTQKLLDMMHWLRAHKSLSLIQTPHHVDWLFFIIFGEVYGIKIFLDI